MNEIGFWIFVVVGVIVHELAHAITTLFFGIKKAGMRNAWSFLKNKQSFEVVASSVTLFRLHPLFRRKTIKENVGNMLDTSTSRSYMYLAGPASHILTCAAVIIFFHESSWWLALFVVAWAGTGLHNIFPRFLPHEKCSRDGEFAMFFLFCSAPGLAMKFFHVSMEDIGPVAHEQSELNRELTDNHEGLLTITKMTPKQAGVVVTFWWATIISLVDLALWAVLVLLKNLVA